MKLILVGGTGHLGVLVANYFRTLGHQVVVVSRRAGDILWDGRTLPVSVVDGADVVVNLAGRSVDCRYTKGHLAEMLTSRVHSTRAVGLAIAQAARPPRVWLQMSTATIYAHSFGHPNAEDGGIIGGDEADAPRYWALSVAIAQAWERAVFEASTPHTRRVVLRTAMVMSDTKGSVFDRLRQLVRVGAGGSLAGGKQYVSWIHAEDFCRALGFLIGQENMEGAFNLCAPHPLPQKEFMGILRRALRVRMGLPASRWMVTLGAFLLRTDAELLLKSRRVLPKRLLAAGFEFTHASWADAAIVLCRSGCRGPELAGASESR